MYLVYTSSLNTAVSRIAADSPTKGTHLPPKYLWIYNYKNLLQGMQQSFRGNAVDDLKLLADERIILAARQAGIKEVELLSQYSGVGLGCLKIRQTKYYR